MTNDPSRRHPETPFGVRLKAARKMAGMSLEDLAGKLGGLVTKQAISKYEQGQMMPSPEVLKRLFDVLSVATWGASPLRVEDATTPRQLAFEGLAGQEAAVGQARLAFRRQGLLRSLRKEAFPMLSSRRARSLAAWESDAAMDRIEFRAGERLPAKSGSALRYRIADYLRRYLEIETLLGARVEFENPVPGASSGRNVEAEATAAEVRRRWDLGTGPIVNLLGLLEDKGIKVYETRGIPGFEGLSGRFGDHPFVAVSVDSPADRIRFTAAHELGHVLCDFGASESPENECHAFGAAFLLPRSALERSFATPRRKVSLGELGVIKETYGLSLQAIMHRARALGFVSDRQFRAFRETIRARGWAVEEPVVYTGMERATRFRRLLLSGVAADILDVRRAAELAGIPAEELEKKIGEIF